MFKKWKRELRDTLWNDTLKFLTWIAILLGALLVASILTRSCAAKAAEAPESHSEGQFIFVSLGFDTHLTEVENYIDDWHRDVRPRFAKRAKVFAPMIVDTSLDYENMDPLVVVTVMSNESNFQPNAISKKGAVGLMQTLGIANRGFDVSTPEGQTGAGVKRLKLAFDTCETLEGALHNYILGNGKCFVKALEKRVNHWIKDYKKAVELHRI